MADSRFSGGSVLQLVLVLSTDFPPQSGLVPSGAFPPQAALEPSVDSLRRSGPVLSSDSLPPFVLRDSVGEPALAHSFSVACQHAEDLD
jgi:hypothetical protein